MKIFKITPSEWKFLGWVWLILVILTFLPQIIGLIATPKGSIFLGAQHINASDLSVYYSEIEQAKEGHYLFKNLFTPEPHPCFIFDPFWLGVGFLAKIFSLSPFFAFQLARFLLLPALLLVSYLLFSSFFEEIKWRKMGFILLVFGSGLGWLSGLHLENSFENPIDLWVPEAFFFLTVYNSPHFIFSLFSIFLIFLFSLFVFENSINLKQKRFFTLGAGFSLLLLAFFHPYHLATIFSFFAFLILFEFFRKKRIDLNFLKYSFILGLFALPGVIYHWWTLKNFEVRYQHFLQNICPTPSFLIIFVSYGFFLVFALLGFFSLIFKKKDKREIFLLSWFLIQFILFYSPFLFQRRLTEGWEMPLAILATKSLIFLNEKIKKKIKIDTLGFKLFLSYLFVFLIFGSNLANLLTDVFYYLKNEDFKNENFAYLDKEECAAMIWLKNNTPEESVVLSQIREGNLIPAFSLRQVYLGHAHQTAKFKERFNKVEKFFFEDNEEERKIFLKRNKIDYLYFKKENKTGFDPENKNYLIKVYDNPKVSIYRVKI